MDSNAPMSITPIVPSNEDIAPVAISDLNTGNFFLW